MKRRIAATAATAALALSGPAAAAARPAGTRSATPPRPSGNPVSRIAHSDQSRAAMSLDVARRNEMAGHRARLAGALADELGGRGDADSIERALAAAETEASAAYARGERPPSVAVLPDAIAGVTGMSDEEISAAFEAMSRNALERRRATQG